MGNVSLHTTLASHALRLANAGAYPFKRSLFYPFKDDFLRRHGIPDGWDKQTVLMICYSCEGMGCRRCTNGIYKVKTYWLERYIVASAVYHIPHYFQPSGHVDVRGEIEGHIRHEEVNSRLATLAALFLFLLHDRRRFSKALNIQFRFRFQRVRSQYRCLCWRFRLWRNRHSGLSEEIPF